MAEAPLSAGYGTFVVLVLLIAGSVWLGTRAKRAVESGGFVRGYFLGNRGLGAWALALTATVQSGGTFMGFPSLVYTHGWAVALWIAGYMVLPLGGLGVLGKRLAQLSRRTGAITVPDLLRARFDSPAVGYVALSFILLFMVFMMVAQFKAGALIMKVAWPGSGALALTEQAGSLDRYYYLGLAIFAITVVGYTLIGGFLAAVWTDLFQSLMMLLGVALLLVLALNATGGLEPATRAAVAHTGPDYASAVGYSPDGRQFLPPGLAFSFFFVWFYATLGSPQGLVRLMASSSTKHIRRSIFLLATYNALIYIPLVIVCICGRALIPDLPPGRTDEIIPRLSIMLADSLPGGSAVAGLILAAPFGAVMATVSGYLVIIASGLVHDLYQRLVNPAATPAQLRRLTYLVMAVVGLIAFAANVQPVAYLQALVVFSGAGAAATFVVPALMAAFWRRATAAGALAAMVTGGATMIGLYAIGFALPDPLVGNITRFRPFYLGGLDPIVWGLAASLVAGVAVSLCTAPPAPGRLAQVFDGVPTPPAG